MEGKEKNPHPKSLKGCVHRTGIECPCPKECPRHGKCCECVAHHREYGKLPNCLRNMEQHKTKEI